MRPRLGATLGTSSAVGVAKPRSSRKKGRDLVDPILIIKLDPRCLLHGLTADVRADEQHAGLPLAEVRGVENVVEGHL